MRLPTPCRGFPDLHTNGLKQSLRTMPSFLGNPAVSVVGPLNLWGLAHIQVGLGISKVLLSGGHIHFGNLVV